MEKEEIATMTSETSPGAILLQEHAAISAVLDYLERAVAALERGQAVDPTLFRDLEDFFTLFVGRCHHGKEEQLLFPALDASPEMATLVQRLEQEHEQGEDLAAAFATASRAYATHGSEAAGPLIAASRAYAAALRQHIALENAELLPYAAYAAAPETRQRLVDTFERYEDEVMGVGTHERLHRMIDTLEPRLAACGA